jgi:hypothetical protein
MKTLIFLCSLFFLQNCSSSNCEGGVKKDGVDMEYYENKNKRYEIQTKNCVCNGIVKYFHENGNLSADGACIKGKNEGLWKYYDANKTYVANVLWEKGKQKKITIFLNNKDSILYDFKKRELFNTNNMIINQDSSFRIFNSGSEIKIINDSLIAISDYGDIIVFTSTLKPIFQLLNVKDEEFQKIYHNRLGNLEIGDRFLKGGFDYTINDGRIAITIYYIESSSDIEHKAKTFEFPLG